MIDTPATAGIDLRRAPLAELRAIDFRAPTRDFWGDEAALWDRFSSSWAGLDDVAWALAGAAPSDAGGPDWSLAEHVGHVTDWQELAIDYVAAALETGRWPSDDEYDGGDFDTFNERRREPWASMAPAAIRERLHSGRDRLAEVTHRLTLDAIRSDEAWSWIYLTLHGHRLDHLAVIEPWANGLRVRQADGDPFVADPRPATHAAFFETDARYRAELDALIERVPVDRWASDDLTPGWTLREHIGHLADWAAEGVRAIEQFHATRTWAADPVEGIDAWNDRQVRASATQTPAEVRARLDHELGRMREAVRTLDLADLRSPDGWAWTYDCLYGHLRKHLALIGPWCAAVDWPAATAPA